VFVAPFPDPLAPAPEAEVDRCLDGLHHLLKAMTAPDETAAMILEPVLGEAGYIPAPVEFIRGVADRCRAHGILFVADEVQSGFGRTGEMFGYQHAGIEPDLVVMAKSLAAGLPLSAVVGKAAIMDAPLPGGLGGTYGGNPLACAAALAVLDVFEAEGLVARASAIGEHIRSALLRLQARVPRIGDVRGLGAMLAIELVTDPASKAPDADFAQRVIDHARDRGLLLLKCGPHKNVVRLLPPLTASLEEITAGLERLDAAVLDALA